MIFFGVKHSFPTQFGSHSRVFCKPGSRVKPLYRARRQENGLIELERTGDYDLYEEIQSHRESCELTSILRRFANGETEVLSRTQGMYGDFSSFPKSYAELLNRLIEGKAMFESLPLEERQRFGNDFGLWLQSFDDTVSRETSDPGPVKELDPETLEVTSKNEP